MAPRRAARGSHGRYRLHRPRAGLGARIANPRFPCGSGRHSLALAARGHRATGLDLSAEAVDHARRHVTPDLAATFTHADMRNSPAGDPFDAAICMGNSFGYLDISGTRTFLTALAVAIRAAGGLVIDFNAAAESILPGFAAEPREMNTGDITVTATNEYDAVNSRLISRYRYRFRRGGEEQTATAPHHVYTSAHIGQLLTDAGFTDIRRRGGPCGETFTLGDGRLILTARRPPDRPMVSR